MNWLSNFIRPKISNLVGTKKDVPENLWIKCPTCDGMLFHSDLKDSMNVCYHCDHHMAIGIEDRLANLFDDGKYENVKVRSVAVDPLKFKDSKKYTDRLKASQSKTGRQDAFIVGSGTIQGQKIVIMAFDFAFMGGSMGAAVGEAIIAAAEKAVAQKAALMVIPASGGARMQEGMLSLMQMPRSIIAVEMVKDAGLPYLVLLTNPTTGGVSASFAMVGDIHISEPGAMIGFAGKRVIQETIREELPEDFQTAEYLVEHGMVDMVVSRKDLPETIGRILSLLSNTPLDGGKGGKSKQTNAEKLNGKSKEGAASAPKGNVAYLNKPDVKKPAAKASSTAVRVRRKSENKKEEQADAPMKKASNA